MTIQLQYCLDIFDLVSTCKATLSMCPVVYGGAATSHGYCGPSVLSQHYAALPQTVLPSLIQVRQQSVLGVDLQCSVPLSSVVLAAHVRCQERHHLG